MSVQCLIPRDLPKALITWLDGSHTMKTITFSVHLNRASKNLSRPAWAMKKERKNKLSVEL